MKRERARILRPKSEPARGLSGWHCVLAGVLLLPLAVGVAALGAYAQQGSFSLPAIDPPGVAARKTAARGDANSLPAGDLTSQAAATIVDPKAPQVARECAELLKMATDLKIEVDKSTQDTLSVTVIRKADAIEELAKRVKDGSGKS